MKDIFLRSYYDYIEIMRKNIGLYDISIGHENRRKQCMSLINAVDDGFKFNKINVLETGASSSYDDGLFGLFLGIVAEKSGGIMTTIDNSEKVISESIKIFEKNLCGLSYNHIVSDSVSFMKETEEDFNLVHLDSFDFDLFNPLPCALHGWEEFKSIEYKLPLGSIIIIDDNYIQGTYLQWFHPDGTEDGMVIKFPIIGKGAHVYQQVLYGKTKWKLIGEHYNTFDNIKIIIQKIR